MTDQHGKTDKDNTGIDKKYLSPSFFSFCLKISAARASSDIKEKSKVKSVFRKVLGFGENLKF